MDQKRAMVKCKRWIRELSKDRYVRNQSKSDGSGVRNVISDGSEGSIEGVMDQGAMKWAMDITSDRFGSKRWIREHKMNQKASKLWSFEAPMDQKAIKVVMDREQAMDQKASDGSGSKDDQGASYGSGSIWRSDGWYTRWIRKPAIDQGSIEVTIIMFY